MDTLHEVTIRLLPARVQAHRDALKGVRSSAVADHSLRTGHDMDWSNVKILTSDSNEQNLFYLESLLILKHRPTLNKMQTSVNINLFPLFYDFIYYIGLYAYMPKIVYFVLVLLLLTYMYFCLKCVGYELCYYYVNDVIVRVLI